MENAGSLWGDGLRWALAAVLAGAGVWISIHNARVFWLLVRGGSTQSWIPLLGGGLCALACWVAPWPGAFRFWWLPLCLDWGSLPGLAHALLAHALRWARPPVHPSIGSPRAGEPPPSLHFPNVDLGASTVVGWSHSEDALLFELDLHLLAGHPDAGLPGSGPRRRGTLLFCDPVSVEGLDGWQRSQGDLRDGRIEGIWSLGEDRYVLHGAFGQITICSARPELEIRG